MADLAAVLPLDSLQRHLLAEGLLGDGPIEARRIGAGHSNLTFLVTQGDRELVVRRPPPPPLPPSAHDVLREARVLRGVEGRLPVARVLAVCADESVIGAPFYVMEHVRGRVLTDTVPPALDAPEDRRRIGEQIIDTLVDLHAVDWRAAGLEQLGRPTGYLERQLARFAKLWQITQTREVPAVDRLTDWLGARAPESGAPTIVHGDYRLGNVMFAEAPPARLVAVFDWEMATIGDPLADVGFLSMFWVQPDDPPLRMFELSQATRSGGFPSRAEMVAWYGERSGRSTADLRFYEVLALWKLAVAMEGMYARAVESGIDNPYLVGFKQGVIELAERGCELAGERVSGTPR